MSSRSGKHGGLPRVIVRPEHSCPAPIRGMGDGCRVNTGELLAQFCSISSRGSDVIRGSRSSGEGGRVSGTRWIRYCAFRMLTGSLLSTRRGGGVAMGKWNRRFRFRISTPVSSAQVSSYQASNRGAPVRIPMRQHSSTLATPVLTAPVLTSSAVISRD